MSGVRPLSDRSGSLSRMPFKADGATFSAEHDSKRLGTQLERVYQAMRRGDWWTLEELAKAVGGSEAGVSARLRDLRKDAWGGFAVERRRVSGGLHEYRLMVPMRLTVQSDLFVSGPEPREG